ncbi:hypothetical protein GAMM_40283 [Gammaproteobacteria bacterium]
MTKSALLTPIFKAFVHASSTLFKPCFDTCNKILITGVTLI